MSTEDRIRPIKYEESISEDSVWNFRPNEVVDLDADGPVDYSRDDEEVSTVYDPATRTVRL